MSTYPKTPVPVFKWGLASKAYDSIGDFDIADVLGPAIVMADITAQIDAYGVTPITQGPTRGIVVDQKGTLTGHDAFGNVITTYALQAGYNPISIGGITSVVSITQIIGVW
jgi:hypothetical protein